MTREQRQEHRQAVLARCYVALAEVDWELRQWRRDLRRTP